MTLAQTSLRTITGKAEAFRILARVAGLVKASKLLIKKQLYLLLGCEIA